MGNFAINHMTAANTSFAGLLAMAQACGCSGVELRNDLASALFDGEEPAAAANMALQYELQIFAVAQVESFNHLTVETVEAVQKLAAIAAACGSAGVALIPANNNTRTDQTIRRQDLLDALRELVPLLEQHGICGFVEPLGFASASLRFKHEVVDAIEKLGADHCIRLVHDTFHHVLAGEKDYYPEHTGMVHVSGVTNPDLPVDQMLDSHRVLVDAQDRLQNVEQILALQRGGYSGPVSMEAFAPEVHEYSNPAEHLQASFQFISSGLAARVA